MLVGPINSGAAVGADGAATATSTAPIKTTGLVYSVYVKYNDAPPATTDVTVKTQGTSPQHPSTTILSLANANTDAMKLPRLDECQNDGTALTSYGALIPVDDCIQVVIAQANAGDNVDVWLMVL